MPDNTNHYYKSEPSIPKSEKGSVNGVATLDGSGLVPSNQLPSYVDDVLEYASTSGFPATGEIGKIYVATDTNKSYRWSGSTYVELSAYALATQAAAGLMSAADKTKLDGVATGATAVIVSDSLSDTSTTKALSAAKGKSLNDQMANLHTWTLAGEEASSERISVPSTAHEIYVIGSPGSSFGWSTIGLFVPNVMKAVNCGVMGRNGNVMSAIWSNNNYVELDGNATSGIDIFKVWYR